MSVTENLKEDLRKIIGGRVESAFELKNGHGLFLTIQTDDKSMALVVEENGYSEGQRTTEVYVIESLV
ncbi:MAG: hypothetical protein KKG33_07080 [candidate division Zixibacteria bacterium]|nr:hypothetical protein [candidate division Zixibacteria bacterium]MBU1470783.1 hypothetical protein [candidate division Zixibacteria bacterium]MBU2625306.1 hypothetical protein [candidate division Zixibacteria bacterium]